MKTSARKIIDRSSQLDGVVLDRTANVQRRTAAANNSRSIRHILIFDNHPASLRLVREIYLAPVRATVPECVIASILLILALALAIWIAW
jgi:hypothetical protein